MSVYKPKGKSPFYHYDFQLRGHRFSGSTERTSKREAKEIEDVKRKEAEAHLDTLAATGAGPLTIGSATSRYYEEVGQYHANVDTTIRNMRRLNEFFGPARTLASIKDDDVAKMVAWRRGQRVRDRAKGKLISATTVNRSVTEPLQKIFNRAIEIWGANLRAPLWKNHLLKEGEERVREVYASEEESLDAIHDEYRPVVDFARASGLRMNNCLLLKKEVDLHGGYVRVIGKGNKAIRQPITVEMRAILMEAMANPTDHVFTYTSKRAHAATATRPAISRGQRVPITDSGLKSIWRRARDPKEAGAPALPADLRFHDMRHDFATKMLRETNNLRLVQRALHHSKIETTTRYAHVLDEDILAGMEALSANRSARKSPGKTPGTIPGIWSKLR